MFEFRNDENKYNLYIVTMTIKLADLINADPRSGPRYRAIADAIAGAIASGALAEGEKLPPMRDLAFALSVTTGTVARAYALAATRQHIASEVGRGTFVRFGPPHKRNAPSTSGGQDTSADDTITMKANLPAEIGQTQRLTDEAAQMIAESGTARFGYLPAGGMAHHRTAGAAWISTGSYHPSTDDIILCSGAQQAIFTAILAATEPGDLILAESLTYHAISAQALMLGRRVMPVEIDHEGLIPEALARACRGSRVTALFTVPTLHNPTTATMSAARRAAIAEVAAAQQLAVIEDDIYSHFIDERPVPIAHLIPERTYYINSLSKTVTPGLRVAYLIPPRDRLDRARAIVHGLGQALPPLMADLATRIITNGTASTLLAKQKVEIAARNAITARVLELAPRQFNSAAMHLWLALPDHWRATAFTEAARLRGVAIAAGEDFMVGHPDQASRHVRLCLGAASSRVKLEQGLTILRDLMAETPIETQTLA